MRITELRSGDIVLSREGEGETARQISLIVLGPSENNDSVVLLSEVALGQVQMANTWDENSYFRSNMDCYLENSFTDYIPCSLRQALVAIQVCVDTSTIGIVSRIYNRRRVFLPSMYELGFDNVFVEGISYINALRIMRQVRTDVLARYAIEQDFHNPCCYWTRSIAGDTGVYCVTKGGGSCVVAKDSRDTYIRPCFSVSVDAEVTLIPGLTEPSYELIGVETRRRIIQEDLFVRLMTL